MQRQDNTATHAEATLMPRISVVIPLYNKAGDITRCLDSVVAQTLTDFEAIVVDDGSTDGGGAFVEGRDSRIRLISQNNGGEAAARNTGIRAACSRLIAFLDADDEWMPEFLSAVVALADRYPGAGLFATGFRRYFDDGRVLERTLRGNEECLTTVTTRYLDHVREGDFVTCSSTAVRRSVFDHVGFFPEGQAIGADVDQWARIALRHPFAYDSRILAIYHSNAATGSFSRCSACPPYPLVTCTLRALIAARRIPAPMQQAVARYIDWRLLNHAYWLLDLRNRRELLRFLNKEHFEGHLARIEAGALGCAAAVLPLRLISALKWKPVTIAKAIREYRNPCAWTGRNVLTRDVKQERPPKGARTSIRHPNG